MTSNNDVCPDMLLYKCVAHFMGRKAPGSSIDSIESIQKPLIEIYTADPNSCMTKDIARDVYLMVFTSGIYAIPVNPIDPSIWIQMQNFRSSTAVKGVSKVYNQENAGCLTFEPLDSPATASSPLPALFTVTAARGNCVPLLDCYVFSCPTNEVALTLVEKTRQAFADRRGWSNSSKPPSVSMLDMSDNNSGEKRNCQRDESSMNFRENVNPELYQKPPLNGFYYAPKGGVIRQFDIGLDAEAYPLPDLNVGSQGDCSMPCQGIRYLMINREDDIAAEQVLLQQQQAHSGPILSFDNGQACGDLYDQWPPGYTDAIANDYSLAPAVGYDNAPDMISTINDPHLGYLPTGFYPIQQRQNPLYAIKRID